MFGLWSVHIILIIFQLTPYVRNFTWNSHLVPHFGLEPVPSKDGLVFLKNDYENGVCCIVTISYLVISKCNLHLRLEVTRQCSRKRNNLIIPKKHIFTWFLNLKFSKKKIAISMNNSTFNWKSEILSWSPTQNQSLRGKSGGV